MNYEFSATYRRKGRPRLVISARLNGGVPGEPNLVKLPAASAGELLFRLIFRPPAMHVSHTPIHCESMAKAPRPLRRIRILLPEYQEFILLSRECECGPHHTVTLDFTPYCPA